MALRINTNVAALNAHKILIKTDGAVSNSLERLSSGLRINKAADDSSGMLIADSLKSQSMSLGQAIKNASDSINIVQTADAALEESIAIMSIIKTKAIQAAQDGQTQESRAAIQSDIDKLIQELDTIAKTTSFNNQKLLSGSFVNKKVQIGAYTGETTNISIGSAESGKIGHVTSSELTLADEQPGVVDVSIFSIIQNETFNIESVDVVHNNTRENSMAALADAINRKSDTLGVFATARVRSTTDLNIVEGDTSKGFSINGVRVGRVKVQTNDADGALDGATLNNSTLSTIQDSTVTKGSVIIRNSTLGANSDIAGKVRIGSTASTTGNSVIAGGSILIGGTRIGAGTILGGDAVMNDSKTTSTKGMSLIKEGSILTSGTVIAADSALGGAVTIDTTSKTIGTSTVTAGSILTSGSVIGADSVLGGQVTIDANTSKTDQDSYLSVGSMVANGSTIGANTLLGASFAIGANTTTSISEGIVRVNSTLGSGSTLGADTVLGGVVVTGSKTDFTTSESLIKVGSILGTDAIFGKGTIVGGTVILADVITEKTTFPSKIANGSRLTANSLLKEGTILAPGQKIFTTSGTVTTTFLT